MLSDSQSSQQLNEVSTIFTLFTDEEIEAQRDYHSPKVTQITSGRAGSVPSAISRCSFRAPGGLHENSKLLRWHSRLSRTWPCLLLRSPPAPLRTRLTLQKSPPAYFAQTQPAGSGIRALVQVISLLKSPLPHIWPHFGLLSSQFRCQKGQFLPASLTAISLS